MHRALFTPGSTTPPRPAPRRSPPARGFALLLVLFVAVVATIFLTILLERQSAVFMAVERQMAGYRDHHIKAGLRVITEVWSITFKLNAERKRSAAPLGYDLLLEGGTRIRVTLEDAQGSVRRRTLDLPPRAARAMNAAAALLEAQGPASARFVRDRGPGRVSLNAAPAEVLQAVVTALDPKASGEGFAQSVLTERALGPITTEKVKSLIAAAGVEADLAPVLESMLAVDPALFRLRADIFSGGRLVDRQEGLATGALKPSFNTAGPTSWAVLDWKRVDPAADRPESEPR